MERVKVEQVGQHRREQQQQTRKHKPARFPARSPAQSEGGAGGEGAWTDEGGAWADEGEGRQVKVYSRWRMSGVAGSVPAFSQAPNPGTATFRRSARPSQHGPQAAAMYTRGRSLPARRRSVSSRRGISTQRSDEYLYRCMRGDGMDLLGTDREAELVGMRERDPVKFAKIVLMAIGTGSKIASPFLHTTRDLQVARKWYNLGRERRQDNNYLVRIQRDRLDPDSIVDMSTKSRQDSGSGSSTHSNHTSSGTTTFGRGSK